MDESLLNTEEGEAVLSPVDVDGNPARVDGAPVWTKLSGNGTIVPAADGLSAVIKSADAADVSVYEVNADADLGAGVRSLTATVTITTTVQEPEAQSLGLSFSKRPKTP